MSVPLPASQTIRIFVTLAMQTLWAYARFWRLGSHNQGHTQNIP